MALPPDVLKQVKGLGEVNGISKEQEERFLKRADMLVASLGAEAALTRIEAEMEEEQKSERGEGGTGQKI